jgi:hypothetical protein
MRRAASRCLLSNEVIEAFWKQRNRLAIFTLYEAFHPVTKAERVDPVQAIGVFSNRLERFCPSASGSRWPRRTFGSTISPTAFERYVAYLNAALRN